MSALERLSGRSALTTRTTAFRSLLVRVVVGDRTGLVLFLGSLLFFMLYWRLGTFITDSNVVVNALVNVADGRLELARAPYGDGRLAPGTYRSGGRAYGRNYGIVLAALPVLWLVEGLSAIADVRVVLVALWSLLLVGLGTTLSTVLDRPRLAPAMSVLAVVAFGLNLAVATPVAPAVYPIVALQVTTLLATALACVFVYRLLARMHGRRYGLCAGAVTALATPVAFWASLPKRHSFTVLFVLVAAYALFRSRTATSLGEHRAFRAFAYVPVGLMAWIHAAEALILLLPLVLVDLWTARSNDRVTLAVVGTALALSLGPFFATNALISGNPLQPPRMLTPYDKQAASLDMQTGSGGSGGVSRPLRDGPVVSALEQTVTIMSVFLRLLGTGFLTVLSEPLNLYHTFVRSGYIEGVAAGDNFQAITLTVIESAPVVATVVGTPVLLLSRLDRGWRSFRPDFESPLAVVDAFVVGYAFLLVCLYAPKLPTFAQVTVRYLHPIYPLAIYGAVRLPLVREVIDDHWRLGLWTFLATVLIGGQLVVIALSVIDPGLGEAVQFHALLGVATALVVAVWVVAASLSTGVSRRAGAAALALATGVGTVFVLLSGLEYFDYAGDFALPVVRALTDLVALV